jgi:hypothetical protein
VVVDFSRNALARSYLLSSFRARRIQRGLLSFRPQGRGNTFRFVQDTFSEACFLFDLRGEAIRFVSCKTRSARLAFFSTSTMRQYEVSLFFSVLRIYPGEGPPYQLRSSRVSVLDKNNSFHLFPPASALQSTQVKGRFISIRGFHRSGTNSGRRD